MPFRIGRQRPQSAIPDGHQLAAAPITDGVHALGPRGDLDIENPLILGDHPPGPLQQDPQLDVGVSPAGGKIGSPARNGL
jgi:hypothetical protein